jgi:sporulation protein YlmC with PRC-barrel domain
MNKSILIVVAVVYLLVFGALTTNAVMTGGTTDKRTGTSSPSSMPQDISPSSEMDRPMAGSGWEMHRLNNLIGKEVRNTQGESLGAVKDFVVDSQGRVAFALIGHGGFMGIGEKFVAVPFGALNFATEDNRFTVDVAKDRFAAAPVYDKDTDMTNRAWAEDAYRFFGQTPYWSESGSFRSEPRSGEYGTQPGMGQQEQPGDSPSTY